MTHVEAGIVGILAMAMRLEQITNAAGAKWGETDSIKRAMKHVRRLREELELVAAGADGDSISACRDDIGSGNNVHRCGRRSEL